MRMKEAYARTQAGVTLFELMLVLFVAAFIAAAVGTIYIRVSNSYKANSTLDNVQQLVANVRGLYSQQGNFKGLTKAAILNSGLIPQQMCKGGVVTACTDLQYPFGAANIVSDTNNSDNQFIVTLSAVPQAVCSDMANRFIPGTVTMTIGGQTPGSVTEVLGDCAANASSDFVLTYN